MASVLRKFIPEPVAQYPTLREIAPDVTRMQAKITELNLLQAKLQAEIGTITGQIAARRGTTHSAGRGAVAPSASVRALLGDVAPAESAAQPVASLEQRAIELSNQLGDIRAAIATLEQPLRDGVMRASWKLCEQLWPAYEALVGKVYAASVALAEALAEHGRFLDSFNEQGASAARLDVLPAYATDNLVGELLKHAAKRLGK